MNIIYILYDYSNKYCLPYEKCTHLVPHSVGFETNCLDFFHFNYLDKYDDVVMCKKDGSYISVRELLDEDNHVNTSKCMRESHNIHKMFIAGAFKWNTTAKELNG